MAFFDNLFKRAVQNRIEDKLDTTKTNALALLDDPSSFMKKMAEDRIRQSIIGAGLMSDEEYEAFLKEQILNGNKEKAMQMRRMAPAQVPYATPGFVGQTPNYLNFAQQSFGGKY